MGHIEATPSLKEDFCMGVMVGSFDLDYDAFDNVLASGKNHRYCFRIYYTYTQI